jgi:membrane-bound lytic murein transglycosylase D
MAASFPLRVSALSLAVTLLVAGLASPPAAAVSRRDQAAAEALAQRMTTAEQRYRAALVKIGNNDPAGSTEGDAALEDMEDVIAACMKLKGCSVPTMLATYKRLLKVNADAQVADGDDEELEGEGDDHAGATVATDVPEAARAAHLLAEDHRFDQMVQYNPAVQAGIRRWLTDMRPALMDSYENYEYMRHMMWPQFERAGLPEALLFGIMAKESNGKVHVSSRAGAAGPMQFMYATGKRFGLGPDGTGFDTRFDARASAAASAAYLNERMGELNRSIELALAAYNGGEGRALRVYRGANGNGFWDASVYNQFPEETRDYVPMVIAAAWLFLHPKQYGLSFPKVDTKPAQLKLARPASIYELTICLGNGGTRDGYMRALRNLNPRYDADSWLPAGASLNATSKIVGLYGRHCANGKRADLAHQLVTSDASSAVMRSVRAPVVTPVVADAATAAPKAEKQKSYRVRSGETLTAISRKFSCDTRALAEANKIKAPRYNIRPGQTLSLASCTAE